MLTDEKPREIAVRVLLERDRTGRGPRTAGNDSVEPNEPGPAGGGEFTESLLDDALSKSRMQPRDRGFCQELVYGVVRWQAPLDWLIARKTQGREQKPVLRNLLRLGLYQIFWLDRIPDHAAVNEMVELTRQFGCAPQSGFVNALLRGYLRETAATEALLAELKRTQPHLGYSHPEWLVDRWRTRWGAEKAAALMDWNNSPPRTFARVNTLKTDAGKLIEQWRAEGVEYDFVLRDWLEENLVFDLKSHPPLGGLTSIREGGFYVQDPGTLLAVRELDPRPGERILDYCAAPGGKLTYIAQLMRNDGRLVAHDSSADRARWIRENCTRLGVTNVEIAAPGSLDASAEKFDRILLDAPCSNTGVMRRRVDLRWRIRPGEIDRLRQMQLDLLLKVGALLKPGGSLVYSTCSLEPDENENVVEEFLRREKRFKLERQRTLLPFADNVDGAYVARLVA